MTRGFWTRWVAVVAIACFCAVSIRVPSASARAPAKQSSSSATRGKTAILPLVVEGELSDADRERLTAELVGGLQRGAFGVMDPSAVVAEAPEAEGCAGPDCFRAVASQMSATHVVRARVRVEDRDYSVVVELFDGGSGASLARTEEGCEICGITDAGSLMATGAATLRTKLDALAKGPSTLTIASEPEGAEVRLDGEIIGITPLERPVIAGKRVVRVSKEGFIAVEREVTSVEGVSEQMSFELEKVPSRLPSRPWGWVSLGVGVGSLATAVAFGVLGATEAEYKFGGDASAGGCFEDADADGNCKFVWNTEWHALGFGVAGGALTTLAVAILLNSRARKKALDAQAPRKTTRRRIRRARVGVGFGNVSLRGRF